MLKSHSLGIGDLLRSSAAWQALHDKFPGVELHLLFLSRHAGYPTEKLIRDHHLLASSHFVTVREGDPSQHQAREIPSRQIKQAVQAISRKIRPDLVIDFETAGLRTSLVARWAAQACGAKTLGIAQFPGRAWFYDLASPSTDKYMARHGLTPPMDYTERDFVALAALGIERNGTPITLEITPDGERYREALRQRIPARQRVIGLNIGCGTADAMPRRPPLAEVANAIHELARSAPSVLLLTGAPFERAINQAFIQLYREKFGPELVMLDLAGETSLSGLTGLISSCDVFISSDSGPYHIAVALHCPTVAWFVREEPAAYHRVPWCRCLINPQPAQVLAACGELGVTR